MLVLLIEMLPAETYWMHDLTSGTLHVPGKRIPLKMMQSNLSGENYFDGFSESVYSM